MSCIYFVRDSAYELTGYGLTTAYDWDATNKGLDDILVGVFVYCALL
jgi:hypothetical protein